MAKLNPQQVAERWATEFGKSGDKYEKGVRETTVNPAQEAIKAKDRMLSNYTEAVTSGRWEDSMSKVTTGAWQTACIEKGKQAIAVAARLGVAKVAAAEREMAPIREGIIASLPGRGTIDQNLERSRLFGLQMHNSRRRK